MRSRKIKVCHMTSAHKEEDVRIFGKECISLAKAGYDVYLVERGDTYDKSGVHIIGVGDIPNNRIKRLSEGSRKVYRKAIEFDCDIYHFHDPELLPYGMKLKKLGKRVIFDSHERYTCQLRNKPYLPRSITLPMAKVYGVYERRVLKHIDAVIFPCTMDGVNPFKGLCNLNAIISNAPVLDEFYDLYDPNVPKKESQVCYVGCLEESRGITNVTIAAYKTGASLALAGDFSSLEYREILSNMAESSCVDYMGKLDRRQTAALMAESSVGLCTLLDRGQYLHLNTFATKVFEYMSMSVPVILSNSAFNCRMVEQYQFGICVDPENVDEIADAIRYLFAHPAEAKRMGENGRKAVKERFNWGLEEKKLLQLYEDILA